MEHVPGKLMFPNGGTISSHIGGLKTRGPKNQEADYWEKVESGESCCYDTWYWKLVSLALLTGLCLLVPQSVAHGSSPSMVARHMSCSN